MATVLVVDDEPTALEHLALSLKEYQVTKARDGVEAAKLLSEQSFDLVIADHEMPNMLGTDLLALCARQHPGTVRILLTGHATASVAIEAINKGSIYRFLKKPCSPTELQATVRDALEKAKRDKASARLIGVAAEVTDVFRSGKQLLQGLGDSVEKLSPREREILELLIRGQRVSGIAKNLSLSPHTVRNHLKSMYRKLGVHSQAELVQLAS